MQVPGSIIGNRYQIIQKLGRSEMGKAYLAKDLQATGDSRCAVEQLNFHCDNEANWRIVKRHLLKEVAVLERLGDHPQIPQLYDHFAEEHQFYLVREYIDGYNLEQEVEHKIFNEVETICLLHDILRILDFVHKTNVIHRDVQPVNAIRRKRDNTFVLIGFGAIREIESTQIDLQGELNFDRSFGNWAYVAPEQKAGESHFSSDLYALAKTAVFALTGRSPQELEENNLNWQKQCQICPKLSAILTKMMSPIVEQRYSSALEVLHDLRPLLKIGQVVGERYLITRYLGGQSGIETYLADNLRRRYQSPCKIEQIQLFSTNSDRKVKLEPRFTEEISILERLGYHEQIPQLWDHFEENDEFYLVREYVRGKSLAQKIARKELSVPEIMQILAGALSVLSFVHQNRIIHRNIKPSSLIIREEDRQVILTDFGILADLQILSHTSVEYSSDRDRYNYWSPEQIAGRPTISSDLYALGMTAIEALTGAKPATLEREPTGKLRWTQNITLDRRSLKIIDRLVELDLGKRYQSANKVLKDLQKVNLSVYSGTPLSEVKPKADRFSRPRLTPLTLTIALLGIGCLLGSIEFAFPTVRPIYYWYRGQKLLPERPQVALNRFTQAIDLKPQSWRAWSGRGNALTLLERYPQALSAYAEASKLNPSEAENWHKRGNILFRLAKFTEAIAAYDRGLELDRDNEQLYNRKGRALYQLQQYQEALTMQETALELEPLNPRFLSDRAQNLMALGQYYEALTTFNRVQAIALDNPKLWQDKFLVLEDLNRPQEAARVRREISNQYTKQLQQQPQNKQLWLGQGNFFTAAKMERKAVDSYNRALAIDPKMYEAWLAKGKVLIQADQEGDALTALDKALQLRPQSYLALQARGSAYLQQNDLSEATSHYERALEIAPFYAPLWRDLGAAFYEQNDYERAIEALTKASSLAPHSVEIWEQLAQAWEASGQDRKAISALDKAIEIAPKNIALWSQKGSIYTKNARYNEACETYRQSRTVIPDAAMILNSMRSLGCRMN